MKFLILIIFQFFIFNQSQSATISDGTNEAISLIRSKTQALANYLDRNSPHSLYVKKDSPDEQHLVLEKYISELTGFYRDSLSTQFTFYGPIATISTNQRILRVLVQFLDNYIILNNDSSQTSILGLILKTLPIEGVSNLLANKAFEAIEIQSDYCGADLDFSPLFKDIDKGDVVFLLSFLLYEEKGLTEDLLKTRQRIVENSFAGGFTTLGINHFCSLRSRSLLSRFRTSIISGENDL